MNKKLMRFREGRRTAASGSGKQALGPAGRLSLVAFLMALVLSLAMVPPPSPYPPDPVVRTYTLYLPVVLKDFQKSIATPSAFGYGWNIFQYQSYQHASGYPQYQPSSFNWLRVSDNPPSQTLCGVNRLPYKVLLRLNKADAAATAQQVADDTWTWAHNMETVPGVNQCVDAFEIGNEPNLSGPGQYNGPVNPVKYADQLCAAYDAIKRTDPSFIVVSAGLAPTGGAADQHLAMESVAFMRAMLEEIQANRVSHGSAGGCFDVFGYHNYGFRVGYKTDPSDTAKCPAEMCFRGVEDIQNILQSYFVSKPIWSTETGWMVDYGTAQCASSPWTSIFAGFAVSPATQASELVGAFQYARANWPWLGAMFVFNLDFNPPRRSSNPCYDEQGWFAVQGRPAETALEAMTKLP